MKILNEQRKIFLIVWLPIIIIITIGISSNLGQPVWLAILEIDGSISWWHGIVGIEDLLFQFLVLCIISLFLFWFVGINDKPIDEQIRKKFANIFLIILWCSGITMLIITYWAILVF